MADIRPTYNNEKEKSLKKKAETCGALSEKIMKYVEMPYSSGYFDDVWEELKAQTGKAPSECKDVETFLSRPLMESLEPLLGKDFSDDVREMMKIRFKGQFSTSMYRKSFRSSDFGFYAAFMIQRLAQWISFCFYDESAEEMLTMNHSNISGFCDFLALEINRGNTKVTETIKEMILGDNNYLLSRDVIIAIILSDNDELKSLLMDLLRAAGRQEGLRQAILESADAGDRETFVKIYRICMEDDMFRFSSAARAFYTWTGLYNDDCDIKLAKKLAETGYLCLTDKKQREKFFESENPLEVYLSLWADGVDEVRDVDAKAKKLINDSRKYMRLLGWYFIGNVENDEYRHRSAVEHLKEDDDEVLSYILDLLHYNSRLQYAYFQDGADLRPVTFENDILPKDGKSRRELFENLKDVVIRVGNREEVFDPSLFPWRRMILSNEKSRALKCMITIAAVDLDRDMIEGLWNLRDYMNADLRKVLYIRFLDPGKYREHREHIYEALKDRSVTNREAVLKKLKQIEPEKEDILKVCEIFKSKNASIKKVAADYMKALSVENKRFALNNLSKGGEYEVQAALELMISDEALRASSEDIIESIRKGKVSSQTEILLDQLTGEKGDEEDLTEENGFGIFDRKVIEETFRAFKETYPRDFLSADEIRKTLVTKEEAIELMGKLNEVFDRHADYEYEYELYDGTRQKILFGQTGGAYCSVHIPSKYGRESKLLNTGQVTFDMIPFHEEFLEILEPWIKNPTKLANLIYEYQLARYSYTGNDTLPWLKEHEDKFIMFNFKDIKEPFGDRIYMTGNIVEFAKDLVDASSMYKALSDTYFGICHDIGEENLPKEGRQNRYGLRYNMTAFESPVLSNIRSVIRRLKLNDEDFSDWFRREYVIEKEDGFIHYVFLRAEEYARAISLGIIPTDCLFEKVLTGKEDPSVLKEISLLTSKEKTLLKEFPMLEKDVEHMVRTMVTIESRRGQSETPLSNRALEIKRFEGADLFCRILSGLGKENFFRGYIWGEKTKNSVLSSLMKKCYPSKDDTAEGLKALLDKTDITEKRLVEAAMYAPQWAPMIEEIIGWKGLKKAVWFFQAHISERFSSEKETEVALCSPISPEKFNDGAFDINWFEEVYQEMGEKRFKELYNSAKYITAGSNAHKRSQLYTDAVRGKLDIKTLEEEIREKRNQERIRAYGLIPLKEGDDKELLRRYEFINEYIKESRKFGAQRKESEGKAGRVALENLAISSGVFDVNRMLWRLEKAKVAQIKPLTEKKAIGEYELWLEFNEDGEYSLKSAKNGKPLKNVPSQLKKDPYVELLKETVSELKEQRVRSRATLEDSMVNRVEFTKTEIANIISSPTISPMIKDLVWKKGEDLGFILSDDELALCDTEGNTVVIGENDKLVIAHPHDLKEAGVWQKYMHYAYVKGIIQPFKQIFREYYPITQEELEERTVSRRYAGYQVEPRKTIALLRGRGWTVDYEDGLQKVSYKENVIVRLYAAADWFSPADIEAPTLEEIQFATRSKGEVIPLSDVDPVLFSEIMRDLDLAVSVAYVGGVDAETSHSTVEMRVAIAKELVQLLKLENVTFTERHARISGKLAEYSVHMGSGVVHAMEKGMIPILPVHSQQRGRVFLPFADEDPKTAEIMSKIILLSEDSKIKDPTILDLLR